MPLQSGLIQFGENFLVTVYAVPFLSRGELCDQPKGLDLILEVIAAIDA